MTPNIVVNATALCYGGALSILRQFIENIPTDNRKWLVFVSPSVTIENTKPNIRIQPIAGVKPAYKRFLWDAFGLSKWLKKNYIEPIATVSLQNTGFCVGKKVPSYIYYHQSIPFYSHKWNPLFKQERSLWFYKNIYPFFIRLFLKKDTTVFVQLNYIKKGFINYFKHPPHLINVFSPSIIIPNWAEKIKLPSKSLNLFYPASDFSYKNHATIIEAINKIPKDIKLYLTISNYKPLNHKVINLGCIPFSQVFGMYNSCDALIFPSYIETFGLPLIEAALTGLPIIAADLPYAREVLMGYQGVTFVKYNDIDSWITEINKLEKGKRHVPLDISNRPGWNELFKLI